MMGHGWPALLSRGMSNLFTPEGGTRAHGPCMAAVESLCDFMVSKCKHGPFRLSIVGDHSPIGPSHSELHDIL